MLDGETKSDDDGSASADALWAAFQAALSRAVAARSRHNNASWAHGDTVDDGTPDPAIDREYDDAIAEQATAYGMVVDAVRACWQIGSDAPDYLGSRLANRAYSAADAALGAGWIWFVDPSWGGDDDEKARRMALSTKSSPMPDKLITTQSFIDEDKVTEKQKNKDYTVSVSPQFTMPDGTTGRAVLDGHHSLEAARRDGVDPELIECGTASHDEAEEGAVKPVLDALTRRPLEMDVGKKSDDDNEKSSRYLRRMERKSGQPVTATNTDKNLLADIAAAALTRIKEITDRIGSLRTELNVLTDLIDDTETPSTEISKALKRLRIMSAEAEPLLEEARDLLETAEENSGDEEWSLVEDVVVDTGDLPGGIDGAIEMGREHLLLAIAEGKSSIQTRPIGAHRLYRR